MTCTSLDLSIDSVLADPVIGAAMRADRVDPRHFETLLRTTARDLGNVRPAVTPLAALAGRVRGMVGGPCTAW